MSYFLNIGKSIKCNQKRNTNHTYFDLQRGEPNELMEPGPCGDVMENPSNADILHLEAAEADRLAGALMNDFGRELVMVTLINFTNI